MNTKGIKAKGRSGENGVVDYLREQGFPAAERRRLTGVDDCGDIGGVRDWMIEVKNTVRREDAIWMAEVEREIQAASDRFGAQFGVCIIKRRGQGNPANWYAEMPVWMLLKIMRALDGQT